MIDLASVLNIRNDKLLTSTVKELEILFKLYFTPNLRGTPQEIPDQALTDLIKLTKELDSTQAFFETTRQTYPEGGISLTRALVYLISNYGITKEYHVNPHVIKLLRSLRLKEHVNKNNHQLIYEINRAVQEKKAEGEIEKSKNKYREYIQNNRKKFAHLNEDTQDLANSLDHNAKAFSRFFYIMEHPCEDVLMRAALYNLIEDIGDKNPDLTVFHAYVCQGQHDWQFLNTVHGYYKKKEDLEGFEKRLWEKKQQYSDQKKHEKAMAMIQFITELKFVDKTHAAMDSKTESQSRWMMVAGAMFGMELSMLALEAIALLTPLSAWFILGVSAAACIVFGPFIALQYYTAHYDELLKMNQENYFAEYLPDSAKKHSNACSWGATVARIGTLEEGMAAGTLLLTLGAFAAFDLVSWGIKGGDYTLPVPGVYFVSQVVLTSTQIWVPIVAVAAALVLLYLAYKATSGLTNAHMALDGDATKRFYNKRKEEANMRGGVNLNSSTLAPEYFSQTLEWKHKISHQLSGFSETLGECMNHNISPRFT